MPPGFIWQGQYGLSEDTDKGVNQTALQKAHKVYLCLFCPLEESCSFNFEWRFLVQVGGECVTVCSSRGHLAVVNICYNMERVPLAPSWWRVRMLQKAEQLPQLASADVETC